MKTLLLVLFLSLAAFAQSELPDRGTLADIQGKTKVYVTADATPLKALVKDIGKTALKLVDRPDDADFIIDYRITDTQYVTAFRIPVEYGQMDVYLFRDKRKVIVWSEAGGKSKSTAATGLLKKFLKAFTKDH